MRIRSLRVKNFRSILDAELSCSALTALVGKNGSGKSALLSALEFFYEPSAKIAPADFYSEDLGKDIEIAITYDALNVREQEFFSKYVEGDRLTVVRIFSYDSGKSSAKLHGMPLQNPDFASVKNLGRASDLRAKYNELRHTPKYSSLPTVGSAVNARAAMTEWEIENPDMCERIRDDGQFFGYPGVGRGHLGRHTQFIRIPAVRDADDDATEKRGSAITEIINLVVRNALANHAELTALKERVKTEFGKIMDDDALVQLTVLQDDLTATLRSFVPDAAVVLRWNQVPELTIPDPQTDVRLEEDGYTSTVTRTGHGLQRAFIFTLLQHLSTVRQSANSAEGGADTAVEPQGNSPDLESTPSLILAIEEPELYQHPSRQRHLASVLMQLAEGGIPGAAANTQVIYTTHSPLFVGLDRFDQIRVLRKEPDIADKPRATHVHSTSMNAVARRLQDATDATATFTPESMRARLQALMTPMVNEGFFADLAVLVEGESDRAAILGTARSMNHDFDAAGIAVIPCNGKTNIDRPLIIFSELGIPTYTVWDSDKDAKTPEDKKAQSKHNKRLLNILGRDEVEWPWYVGDKSACFEDNLDKTIQREIGDQIFDDLLSDASDRIGIQRKDARKNVHIVESILVDASAQGKECATLRSIVQNIVTLKEKGQA